MPFGYANISNLLIVIFNDNTLSEQRNTRPLFTEGMVIISKKPELLFLRKGILLYILKTENREKAEEIYKSEPLTVIIVFDRRPDRFLGQNRTMHLMRRQTAQSLRHCLIRQSQRLFDRATPDHLRRHEIGRAHV